jgi:hypothetical protein
LASATSAAILASDLDRSGGKMADLFVLALRVQRTETLRAG